MKKKDVIITLDSEGRVYLPDNFAGFNGENLMKNIIFKFKDDFVNGTARVDVEQNGNKYSISEISKENDTYKMPIKSSLLKTKQFILQLVITEGTNEYDIPIFKSNTTYLFVGDSINATGEIPEEYQLWIDIANTKLNSIDEALKGVKTATKYAEEQGDYAKEQGDYAKEQGLEAGKQGNYAKSTADKLLRDKAEGLFKGEKGDVGPIGPKGEQGIPGIQGPQGETYQVNDEDLQNIANQITEDANSAFNQNVLAKTKEFNANADQKTNEFNENADELQQEIEYLKENQIAGSAVGSYIHVKDSSLSKLKKLNIDGVGEQETTKGKQLFDFRDVSSKSDTITNDDEGWVTFVGNNVNGSSSLWGNFWTNNLQLKENTKYLIITEVKNVSGNGYIAPHSFFGNSGQFLREDPTSSTDERFQFSNLSAGQVIIQRATTRDNFSDITRGLRTYCLAMAGQSGSITFRLSVLEDVTITPENFVYEEYTGGQPSPSSSYPKPISVIEGNLNVTSCNKNLIKLKTGVTKTSNGITAVVQEDGGLKVTGTSTNTTEVIIPLETPVTIKNNTFTFSTKCVGSVSSNSIRLLKSTNGSLNEVSFGKNYVTLKSNNTVKIVSSITDEEIYSYYLFYCNKDITVDAILYPQLEEGSTATPYDQHLESQITANLPEGEFAGKIDDTDKDTFKVKYNQEDGKYHLILNKKIGRVVLNGSETFQVSNTIDNDKKRIWYSEIKDLIKKPADNDIVGKILCSHYVPKTANKTYLLEQGISVDTEGYIFIYDNSNNTTDLTAFKNWLSTHNITIYYALATPYEVDLGIINMPLSYRTVTNIFTDSELNPNIEIEYYKDLETIINNLASEVYVLKEILINEEIEKINVENIAVIPEDPSEETIEKTPEY